MSFRRTLSLAAITALVAIGSAQAGVYENKQPKQTFPSPGFTTNSITANNIAAGYGNKANQNIYASQSGSPTMGVGPGVGVGSGPWPGVTTNSLNANNIAAGFGNTANQNIMSDQRGGHLPTFNSVDALNLAAGEHNRANQTLMTQQR